MNVKEAFGMALREEREKNGMTQATLAGYCNLDPESISLYERGKMQPTLGTIINLSKALNVRAEYLVAQVMKHLTANTNKD